jgi:hypothetical protein
MKAAVEHIFTGPTGSIMGPYDDTKTLLGSLMRQYTGINLSDKFISTSPAAIINQLEIAGGNYNMPHAIQWSDNIFWVFVGSTIAAGPTRNIGLYEFDKNASTITWKGFITLSGTTFAGSKTIRALRGFIYKHTTGNVSTSGISNTIIGSGTGFQSERIAVGARIGFGTTDPTQVTTWYEISSINSDTSLNILGGGIDLSPLTPYVIEEVRIAVATANTAGVTATLQNGGVHLIKGLNYSTFTPGGTIILEASLTTPANVDNVRASYLLKDPLISNTALQTCTISQANPGIITVNNHGLIAGDPVIFTTTGALPTGLAVGTVYYVTATSLATNTFTVSATLGGVAIATTTAGSGVHTVHTGTSYSIVGLGSNDFVNNTQQDLYAINLDNAANVRVIKFNLRAVLTVENGYSISAYELRTGTQTIVGTVSGVNNGRVFTVNHGPALGIKSLWFVTTTRIYRCALSNITSLSPGWISDFMIEIPPGSSTTYSLTNSMNQVDYSETIDRIFVPTTTLRIGTYVGQYDPTGTIPFDKIIGTNLNRLKLTTTPSGTVDGLFPAAALTLWTNGGYMFAIPNITTTGQNWLYVFPMGADALYAPSTNQRIITPKLSTPNASKLYKVYVDHSEYVGSYGLGFQPEAYKIYFRTSGIDDNSGAWTEIGVNGDLSIYTPTQYIQFMFELDTLGETCVPTRVYSIGCLYEDGSQDSHYEPSLTKSSAQNRQFSWRQISLWGGIIPDLRIRLYNISNNAVALDDNISTSVYGTFEYSTDGNTWLSWNSSADAIGNYLRYTANANVLGNGITVRALLTQV